MTSTGDPSAALPFTGRLSMRGDADYEAARVGHLFNARIPSRYPAAVLQAQTEQDVVEGVRLAKRRGWKVAIRAGGHSFPVWSLRDDGLLIDLHDFREMSYDPATEIATVTPTIHSGDELNPYLKPFDRFFNGGACPSIGLGGFLLHGGLGWNFRGWGYAANGIVAIDVVTADGELVHASADENADLWWAARGVGPGYPGAITRFHLRTRPIPKALTITMQMYPIEAFTNIIPWLFENQQKIGRSVHLMSGSMTPPMEVPNHKGGLVYYIMGLAFTDTPEEAAAALAPLNENPFIDDALLVTRNQPTTLEEQVAFTDSVHPAGLRYRVDSAWVTGKYKEVAEASRQIVAGRQTGDKGHTFLQFTLPLTAPDMALTLATECMIGTYQIYESEEDDARLAQWLRSVMVDLEPFTVGQYWGDSDQEERAVKCLTDDAFARYTEIRATRDPDGLFVEHAAKAGGFRNVNEWEEGSRQEKPHA
ncbi:FAD-binding oxidoreductase [Phyllobacterium sp. K27]